MSMGADAFVTKMSGVNDTFGSGATRDSAEGKPRYDLIPPEPLRRVAMVYYRGGVNRGDMNWTQGVPTERMIASAMRHLEQYRAGEADEDHAGQAVWNLLGAMHFEGSEWDDRYDWSVPPRPAEDVVEASAPFTLDAAHLAHQAEWSEQTFGPGQRVEGVIDHIRKELDEVLDAPTDLSEWADVIILALDGARRSGAEPQAILDAVKAKQDKNEGRTWPDWRTQDPDKAIEHDRSDEVCDALPPL